MSGNIFFISDLHFHHDKILNFSGDYREGVSVDEHNEILVKKWNSVVGKRDVVYVLGDVVFGSSSNTEIISELQGIKHLALGNHDSLKHLQPYFNQIFSLKKFRGYWLSHAPIHHSELRGLKNIHGHTHNRVVLNASGEVDHNYINVCVEQCNGYPVPFEDIVEGQHSSKII